MATTIFRPTLSLSSARLSFSRTPKFSLSSTTSNSDCAKQLILYSKPGCCLCDGLKEKLSLAFSLTGATHSLSSIHLQVRNILENEEWERKFQYEIPVLAKVLDDGSEEILPRLSPRLSVELIQKKIATAFEL